jgi:hypothetical protein
MASSASFIIRLFERFGFSNTYWSYYPGIEKDFYFTHSIVRPYPLFIAGILKKYSFNHETGVFNCSWEESPLVKPSTVIYIPDMEHFVRDSITLNPESSKTLIQPVKNSKAGYLIIPVTGNSLIRTVEFRLKN